MIIAGPPPTVRSVTRHGRKVTAIIDDVPQIERPLSLGAQRALAQLVADHLGEPLDNYDAPWTVVRFPHHRSAMVTLWKD